MNATQPNLPLSLDRTIQRVFSSVALLLPGSCNYIQLELHPEHPEGHAMKLYAEGNKLELYPEATRCNHIRIECQRLRGNAYKWEYVIFICMCFCYICRLPSPHN